jgi:hypothetical protein
MTMARWLLGLAFAALATSVLAQNNVITPNATDLIQIISPFRALQSNTYTTPAGIGISAGSVTASGTFTTGHIIVGGPGSTQAQDSSALATPVIAPNGVNIGSLNALTFPGDSPTGGSIAIGALALTQQPSLTPGTYSNTAIGYTALGSTSMTNAAINNTAIGFQSMAHNTSGSQNVAVGYNSLNANTTGLNNDAIGWGALGASQVTQWNNVMGHDALAQLVSGNMNVAIGEGVAFQAVDGANNVLIGGSVANNATGAGFNFNKNVIIGQNAGFTCTTCNSNTLIGWSVGSATLTTAARNILIGTNSNCDTAASGTNDTIYICSSTTSTPWLTGSLVSASLSATFGGTLTVAGIASAAQADVVCTTAAGLLTYQVSATGCASSSIRFKQGLRAIADATALDTVTRLEPKSYHYRPETAMGDDIHFGFTAEQVGKIEPDLITYEEDGQPHAVKYNELHAFYAGAFRQLKADNDNLRTCMDSWKCRIFGWR